MQVVLGVHVVQGSSMQKETSTTSEYQYVTSQTPCETPINSLLIQQRYHSTVGQPSPSSSLLQLKQRRLSHGSQQLISNLQAKQAHAEVLPVCHSEGSVLNRSSFKPQQTILAGSNGSSGTLPKRFNSYGPGDVKPQTNQSAARCLSGPGSLNNGIGNTNSQSTAVKRPASSILATTPIGTNKQLHTTSFRPGGSAKHDLRPRNRTTPSYPLRRSVQSAGGGYVEDREAVRDTPEIQNQHVLYQEPHTQTSQGSSISNGSKQASRRMSADDAVQQTTAQVFQAGDSMVRQYPCNEQGLNNMVQQASGVHIPQTLHSSQPDGSSLSDGSNMLTRYGVRDHERFDMRQQQQQQQITDASRLQLDYKQSASESYQQQYTGMSEKQPRTSCVLDAYLHRQQHATNAPKNTMLHQQQIPSHDTFTQNSFLTPNPSQSIAARNGLCSSGRTSNNNRNSSDQHAVVSPSRAIRLKHVHSLQRARPSSSILNRGRTRSPHKLGSPQKRNHILTSSQTQMRYASPGGAAGLPYKSASFANAANHSTPSNDSTLPRSQRVNENKDDYNQVVGTPLGSLLQDAFEVLECEASNPEHVAYQRDLQQGTGSPHQAYSILWPVNTMPVTDGSRITKQDLYEASQQGHQQQLHNQYGQQPQQRQQQQQQQQHRQQHSQQLPAQHNLSGSELQGSFLLDILQQDTIMADCFHAWARQSHSTKQRLHQIQKAYLLNVQATCFNAWHEISDEHSAQLCLALHSFPPWQWRAKGRCFRQWSRAACCVQEEVSMLVTRMRHRHAHRVLQAWRSVVQHHCLQTAAMQATLQATWKRWLWDDWRRIVMSCRRLKHAAMIGWRQGAQKLQAKRLVARMADMYDCFRVQRTVFRAWRQYHAVSAVLAAYHAHCNMRAMAKVMQALQDNVQLSLQVHQAAQQHSNAKLIACALRAWASTLNARCAKHAAAIRHYHIRQQGRCFQAWVLATVEAQRLSKQKAQLTVRQYVGAWRQYTAACSYSRCRTLASCLRAWHMAAVSGELSCNDWYDTTPAPGHAMHNTPSGQQQNQAAVLQGRYSQGTAAIHKQEAYDAAITNHNVRQDGAAVSALQAATNSISAALLSVRQALSDSGSMNSDNSNGSNSASYGGCEARYQCNSTRHGNNNINNGMISSQTKSGHLTLDGASSVRSFVSNLSNTSSAVVNTSPRYHPTESSANDVQTDNMHSRALSPNTARGLVQHALNSIASSKATPTNRAVSGPVPITSTAVPIQNDDGGQNPALELYDSDIRSTRMTTNPLFRDSISQSCRSSMASLDERLNVSSSSILDKKQSVLAKTSNTQLNSVLNKEQTPLQRSSLAVGDSRGSTAKARQQRDASEAASIPSIAMMRQALGLPKDGLSRTRPASVSPSHVRSQHAADYETSSAGLPQTLQGKPGQISFQSNVIHGSVKNDDISPSAGLRRLGSKGLHLLQPSQLLQLLEADVIWFDDMLGATTSLPSSPRQNSASSPARDARPSTSPARYPAEETKTTSGLQRSSNGTQQHESGKTAKSDMECMSNHTLNGSAGPKAFHTSSSVQNGNSGVRVSSQQLLSRYLEQQPGLTKPAMTQLDWGPSQPIELNSSFNESGSACSQDTIDGDGHQETFKEETVLDVSHASESLSSIKSRNCLPDRQRLAHGVGLSSKSSAGSYVEHSSWNQAALQELATQQPPNQNNTCKHGSGAEATAVLLNQSQRNGHPRITKPTNQLLARGSNQRQPWTGGGSANKNSRNSIIDVGSSSNCKPDKPPRRKPSPFMQRVEAQVGNDQHNDSITSSNMAVLRSTTVSQSRDNFLSTNDAALHEVNDNDGLQGAVYLTDFLSGGDISEVSDVSDEAGFRSYEVHPRTISRVKSAAHSPA